MADFTGAPHTSRIPNSNVNPIRPKSTRRSILKTRTGCITCKARHIKCDETRPHCHNCLRSRGYCAGYANAKKASGPVQICWDSKQNVHRAVPKMNPQEVRANDFHDSMGMRYFEEFVGLVRGPWILAVSNVELWQVSLPQLARSNQTLRCIAIGIGALSVCPHQVDGSNTNKRPMLCRSRSENDSHYQNAVGYYCWALKLLRENTVVQDVVSSSVLLLFFELLRGNMKTALDHLNHGLSLMLTLLTDDADNYLHAVAPNPKPFFASITGIFTLLAPQARFVLPGSVGQERPLPNFVTGLEGKGMTMDSFIVKLGQLSRQSVINDCSSAFDSLGEFEEHLGHVRRSNSAVGPMAVEIIQNSGVLGSTKGDAIDAVYCNLLDNPQIKEFCEHSRKAMHTLSDASLPLFDRIFMSDSQSPLYLKAIHLRLQFLQVYAFENPPQYLNMEILSLQTPLFREYLSLARIALKTAEQKVSNFPCHISLECAIAWHLLLIAFFCRDPLTREESVQMLSDYPCQDGLWNVQSLYILALKSQDVERKNATEGTSTEQWQRLWRREYVFEDGGNRVVFRYQDRDDDTGDWRTVEEFTVASEIDTIIWTRRPLTGFGALTMGDLVPQQTGP